MRRVIPALVFSMPSAPSFISPPSSHHRMKVTQSGAVDGVVPPAKRKLSKVELAAQRKRDTWRARTAQFIAAQLLSTNPLLPIATIDTTATSMTNISTVNPTSTGLSPKEIFVDVVDDASSFSGPYDSSNTTAASPIVGGRVSDDTSSASAGFPSGDVVLIHNGGSMCNINPTALLDYLHAHTPATTTPSSPTTPTPLPRLFVSSSGTFSGVLVPRGGGAVSLSRLLQLLHPPPINSSNSSGITDLLDAAGVFKKCTTTPNVAGVFHADILRRYVRVPTDIKGDTINDTGSSGGGGGGGGSVVVDLFALLFPSSRLITRGVYPPTPTTTTTTSPLPTASVSDSAGLLRSRVICGMPEGTAGGPCKVAHLGTLPTTSSPSTQSEPPVSLFGFPDVCPGLYIIPNFVTPDEERQLLQYLSTPLQSTTTVATDAVDEEVIDGAIGQQAVALPPPNPMWDFLLGGRKVMHMNRRFVFENNSCVPTVADLVTNGVSTTEDRWRALVPTHPIVTDILKRLQDATISTPPPPSSSSPPDSLSSAQLHLKAALSLQHTRFGDGEGGVVNFDQLTVNEYPPGSGIPSHVDAHHCFHSPILSISLGARECVMNMREPRRLVGGDDGDDAATGGDEKKSTPATSAVQNEGGRRAATQPRGGTRGVDVFLPRGSLLILSGPARYAYTHGIDDKVFHTVGGEVMGTSEPPGSSGCTPHFVDPNVRFSISCRAVKVVPGCEDCQAPHLCDGTVFSSSPILDQNEEHCIGI